jgi:hypothetical protein
LSASNQNNLLVPLNAGLPKEKMERSAPMKTENVWNALCPVSVVDDIGIHMRNEIKPRNASISMFSVQA